MSQKQSPRRQTNSNSGLQGSLLNLQAVTMNNNSNAVGGLSPTRNTRQSPINFSKQPLGTWGEILRKEQEKIAKKLMNKGEVTEEQDDETDYEWKHPYVQTVIEKVRIFKLRDYQEVYAKKHLVKTQILPTYHLKEYLSREKNLLTDLPDLQQSLLFNGSQFQLKKAFGQYQHPINKAIHFISQQSVIFFVGNYLAIHNVIKDETKYIGIEVNLSEITAFEVQPFDTQQKAGNTSPPRSFNTMDTNQSNYSPQTKQDFQIAAESVKDSKYNPSAQNTPKEMQALLAFAERAKETMIKESKFQTKKVYGISNQRMKRMSQSVDLRNQMSPLKSPTKVTSEEQFDDNGSNSIRWVVKVNVFNLYNPNKKYVLQHFFDDYFYVQQIHIRDKESLCYTLCANILGEQLFFIWNFRKEIVIGFAEMAYKINKFVVTQQKSDTILFLGDQYLKYYEANFTNKIIKENNNNIIPMKIEKESNFIDMDYIPLQKGTALNSEMFVLITEGNSIFIYDNEGLRHKIFDQFAPDQAQFEEGKFDSIMSDSLDIGELSDRENIGQGEDHLRIKSKGTNAKEEKKKGANNKKRQESQININNFQEKMKITGGQKSSLIIDTNEQQDTLNGKDKSNPNSLIRFQKLIVTQKGFIIGSENGFVLCYEFKNDFYPKLVHKIHISNKIQAIVSMSISRNSTANDDFMIAVGGVYQKKVKKSLAKQAAAAAQSHIERENIGSSSSRMNRDNGSNDFFMPNVIKKRIQQEPRNVRGSSLDMRKKTTSLNFNGTNSKFSQVFEENQETQEKLELMIVNMKAIVTLQHNKTVEKIYQKGAHDGSIFQISQCRNKSSFYTISEGQTLKLWNHTNEWRSTGNFTFDEQPLCIDVHPSSWQIAVGFKSGLKIYQSLDKEIKLSFEKLGKASFSVAYSEGGNLLACTNAVYIDIIDPIRMQLVITLFGHKGLVKNLLWTQNNKYLISSCTNGGLYFWKGNFKEILQRNIDTETVPLGQLNDKNYMYLSLAYDDDLDVIIALTTTSTLRLIINQAQEAIYEQDLLGVQSCYGQSNSITGGNSHQNIKATCMSFSKQLNIIVVGFSNGKISVIAWPIVPNIQIFKYDIFLQSSAITDLKFSYLSRYLLAGADDGNFYILESFRLQEGSEKPWVFDNQERLQLQKKRETHNFTGFSALDNVLVGSREVMQNVTHKIEKLRTMKKSQEINHEIKKRKTEKKYDKQMKLIEKELQEELSKQERLIQASKSEFTKEKDRLKGIMSQQKEDHREEKESLVDNKERNLNFVSNENDDLETRILRLKETIVSELEKIEQEHQTAVSELVRTYESSVKLAQDEVKSTIDKLRSNGSYYENMVQLQERDYENEVAKLQGDLIGEHTEFMRRKEDLQKKQNELKEDYQQASDKYKSENHQRKNRQQQVRDMQQEYKFKFGNVERLGDKGLQSEVFIGDKDQEILGNIQEKKQLENLIVFLAEKIKELKDERKPLEERRLELEGLIEETYRELQEDFQFRKYLELKEDSLQKKMDAIKKDIEGKVEHKDAIEQKKHVFKRELLYLAEAKNLKGWTQKMQGMLKCMMDVYHSLNAHEVKNISMSFIHLAELLESNSRPYRQGQDAAEDTFTKHSRLNEMELAYYRNKNSEKMREMQFRYRALFGQMEKQIKKMRGDNIKLIEEFNTLVGEKKKLNNLRKMIKESIREFAGETFKEEMINSSDDDAYKIGGQKKKTKVLVQQQVDEGKSTMVKSKLTSSFVDRHAKMLQNNLTARGGDTNKLLQQLPDLKTSAGQSQISQISIGGSLTQRETLASKGAVGGFSLGKSQQLMSKRRMINSITATQQTGIGNSGTQDNSKYLERIVVEFEKNKKQIEEQTKNLQKIQVLADVMLNPATTSQSVIVQGGAVPNLNLKKINLNAEISQKQTITTRIPNTSERTKVSIMDTTSGLYTNRKLPVVKERNSQQSLSKEDTYGERD